jgi:hypothetical protein
MNQRHHGFILLFTLCLIAVISLLLLTGMQQVLLFHKAINQQEKEHQNFYQLEHIAFQLANPASLNRDLSCRRQGDFANQVIEQLMHHKGCSFLIAGIKYHYLVEDLGAYSCLVVTHNNNYYSTHHWRVTLQAQFKEDERALLQIRVIQPGPELECTGELHPVMAGISSWRYLVNHTG